MNKLHAPDDYVTWGELREYLARRIPSPAPVAAPAVAAEGTYWRRIDGCNAGWIHRVQDGKAQFLAADGWHRDGYGPADYLTRAFEPYVPRVGEWLTDGKRVWRIEDIDESTDAPAEIQMSLNGTGSISSLSRIDVADVPHFAWPCPPPAAAEPVAAETPYPWADGVDLTGGLVETVQTNPSDCALTGEQFIVDSREKTADWRWMLRKPDQDYPAMISAAYVGLRPAPHDWREGDRARVVSGDSLAGIGFEGKVVARESWGDDHPRPIKLQNGNGEAFWLALNHLLYLPPAETTAPPGELPPPDWTVEYEENASSDLRWFVMCNEYTVAGFYVETDAYQYRQWQSTDRAALARVTAERDDALRRVALLEGQFSVADWAARKWERAAMEIAFAKGDMTAADVYRFASQLADAPAQPRDTAAEGVTE